LQSNVAGGRARATARWIFGISSRDVFKRFYMASGLASTNQTTLERRYSHSCVRRCNRDHGRRPGDEENLCPAPQWAEEDVLPAPRLFGAVFHGRGRPDGSAGVRLSRNLIFEIEAARHFAALRLHGEEQIGQLIGVFLLLSENLLHHPARDRVFLAEV